MKWIFEGRVYSSLEELSGKTMSEGNKPEPVFTEEELFNKEESAFNAARSGVYFGSTIEMNLMKISLKFKTFQDYKNKKIDVGEGAESESELQ